MNLLDELEFKEKWTQVEVMLLERFGKKPDMEGILYLIGINELGDVPEKEFTKEQKQDLMHIAVCTVLAPSGSYRLDGKDEEAWPHFSQIKPLPENNLKEQEDFLKDHILLYFQNLSFFES